jgi:exodeoxyribonuclease V beta subunit
MAPAREAVPAYAFPQALRALPRDASAVVEASAGTGKTFLLEHLVADRIVRGDARLEEILVVTFTEKATMELVRRLRALVERLLAHDEPLPAGVDPDSAWRLDGEARARLLEAQRAFDRATITTIHGFCQRVLTEDAFASRRLLAQEHVDSKRAFAEAFRETLRTTLATDERLERYLGAWLASGRTTDALERTLAQAFAQQRPWGLAYDEERLRGAARALLALPIDECLVDVERVLRNRRTSDAVVSRVRVVRDVLQDHEATLEPALLLLEIDALFDRRRYAKFDLFSYVEKNLPAPPPGGAAARLKEALLAFADAAVPLELAAAQLFLPPVRDALAARKSASGQYDFDDMLRLVAEGLRGPGGPALVETLRRRYRLAVIDEFQDTDDVQWEIFRTVFHGSGGRNPLIVIGDPKQSIYGFRGADVATYREARRDVAGGVPTLTLDRNFRSTPSLIGATNAIFDDAALEPFFGERGLFRAAIPGVAAEAGGREPAPIELLAVRPAEGADVSELRLRHMRRALTQAIADEIEALRAGPSPTPLREIFVLTRTNAEAQQIATTLRGRGLPHVLYNQEGLYKTEEARQLRELLSAVDDPRDPTRRLLAALTPFFGLGLGDLPALAADPTSHPLEERLAAWRTLADAREWSRLFERIVSESGLVEREVLTGGSARRLTNVLHLCEILRARALREPVSLGELVRTLAALTDGLIVPDAEEGNVQRLEGDRDAVQIMSIHKAKGLEADHVFLYGAFTPWRGSQIRLFERGGERWLFVGRPRRANLDDALARDSEGEDQRLLYVALTRARRRLYLPYAGAPSVEESAPQMEDFWRVNGAYRHVHRRLRALSHDPAAPVRFDVRPVPCPPPPDDTPARIAAAVRAWRPAPADLALDFPAAELAEARRRRAGVVLTSYSRIKQAHGGYQPPTEVLDEQPAAAPPPPDPGRLPGGALSGIFLHAVLEATPLESLASGPAAADWAARTEIAALFDEQMRRHDRDPAHRADAERMVHAALTTPLALPSGATLPGVARAARVARELEFLFPFPAAAGGADAGFVKGYVDFIFEHEGRTYFGDWKSDLLPDFSPAAVSAHVSANYELQRRLYALALVKMLGIAGEADYEARFGGTVYAFVRALPDGLEIGRPSWADVQEWERELAADLLAPDAGGAS